MQTSAFSRFFLLPLLAYYNTHNDGGTAKHWNYKQHGADWGGICSTGLRQSPILLSNDNSKNALIPQIIFNNYDVMLRHPLKIKNNGHSVYIEIPQTVNGRKPFIFGGLLKGEYEAQSFHFHWGSPSTRGAEHWINKHRADVEMHIVHINKKYSDLEEAGKHSDGIAVLAIMFTKVKTTNRHYPGLSKIFAAVSHVIKYNSESKIHETITAGQLLGDLDTREFFTYSGSFTTPNCDQSVTWTVFPQFLPLPIHEVAKLWHIHTSGGHNLFNNYRIPLPLNGRNVFYRLPYFNRGAKTKTQRPQNV